ncbi:hypothetical protein PHET_04176 [Paragonimus heterotremus]|uniref:Uncharacterized protein n=1 Tax=Paragonimus heterotremus TaxID=100268 RepID=A0A8J4TMR2_9TREM|nr:hypothetical protein PHET_04176 [Paragonimus heterotremus]
MLHVNYAMTTKTLHTVPVHKLQVHSYSEIELHSTSERMLNCEYLYLYSFLLAGLVFAYGPCASFRISLPSDVINIALMAGGLVGHLISCVAIKTFDLRSIVRYAHILLIAGWMFAYPATRQFVDTVKLLPILCTFFVNGVATGLLFNAMTVHMNRTKFPLGDSVCITRIPQIGIAAGAVAIDISLHAVGWEYSIVICLVLNAMALFLCDALHNVPLNSSEIQLFSGAQNHFAQPFFDESSHVSDDVPHDMNVSSSTPAFGLTVGRSQMTPTLMHIGILVCFQHLTGLCMLSLPEAICLNLASYPRYNFSVYLVLTMLGLCLGNYFSYRPVGMHKPILITSLVYFHVAVLYYCKLTSGSFIPNYMILPVLVLLSCAASMGWTQFPLLYPLDNLPAHTVDVMIKKVLTLWWSFGLFYSISITLLQYTLNYLILFLILTQTNLIAAVILLLSYEKRQFNSFPIGF